MSDPQSVETQSIEPPMVKRMAMPFLALVERMNHLAASLPLNHPTIHNNLWVELSLEAQSDDTHILMVVPRYPTDKLDEITPILNAFNAQFSGEDEAPSSEAHE